MCLQECVLRAFRLRPSDVSTQHLKFLSPQRLGKTVLQILALCTEAKQTVADLLNNPRRY